MATMININGTLTLDQTVDLQDNDVEIGDDDATSDAGNDLTGLSNDFITFLGDANLTGLNVNVLSATQLDFADDVEAVVSGANFVTVTQNDAEINDLFFSDADGDPLDGDQVFLPDGVTPLQTVNGDNVYLWSFGDFVLATTSNNPADKGDVVAAFYLNEAGDHLSASIEYVSFIGFAHPDETDHDDTIDFTDILNVSASATLSFEFDTLKSGKFLWVAVGNDDNGLLVTGRDLNVNDLGSTPEGKVGQRVSGGDDPSDAMNISQGGADIDGDSDASTMGINNQMFREGNVGVFTLVEGFGLLGDGPDATGDDVEEIDYDGYTNVGGAGFFISQVQGSGTEINLTVRVVEAGGGTTPEEGFDYIGNEGGNDNNSGAFIDDTPVNVKTVTILDATGAEVATWGTGGVASGTPVDGVTVTIAGHELTVMGINNNYTVKWTVVDGETFNRFQVEALEGLDFDIGRVDIDEGVIISEPVGDSLFVDDDGPTIDIDVSGNTLDLGMDESILLPQNTLDEGGSIAPGDDDVAGETEPDGTNPFGRTMTASGDIAALFSDVTVDPGTDGDDRTDSYKLSLTDADGNPVTGAPVFDSGNVGFNGVETTMSVSADPAVGGDATIYLFLIDDETIEGRVDLDGDGTYDDVALRFSLDPDAAGDPPNPILTTEQILAVNHGDDTDHDDAETLGIAGADPDPDAGLGIVKTSTLEDGDDPTGDTDEDSATYNFTGDVVIEDDGPIVDILAAATNEEVDALFRNLDETVDPDGDDTNDAGADTDVFNPAVGETESVQALPNGDDDDVIVDGAANETPVYETAPDGFEAGYTGPDASEAIGELRTMGGALAALFDATGVDFGTDGPGDLNGDTGRTDSLSLVLDNPVKTTLTATAVGGSPIENFTAEQREIWLVWRSDTVVEGVTRGADMIVGDGDADEFVIFRITLTDPDTPTLSTLVYEQFAPIQHADENLFDEEAPLLIDPAFTDFLKVRWTANAEDADDDTDGDFAEVTLIDHDSTVLSFDDDGLDVGDLALGVIEEDDLRPAADSNSDGNDEDGSVGTNPRGNVPAGNHILVTDIAAIAVDVGIEEPPIFALLTDTSGLPALTSKGETVEYEVVVSDDNGTLTPNDDEYTLHAFVDVGDDNDTFDDGTDREVFRWVVTAAGLATFIDIDQIDHAIATMSSFPALEEEEEVNLTSILAIREADGDLINFSVIDPEFAAYQIQDDVPIIAKTLAGVADDIEGGTVEFLPGESFSRSLKGSVGTDENDDNHLSGDGVTATYTFTDASVNNAPSIPGLTADIVDGLDGLANARVVYFTDGDSEGNVAGVFDGNDTLWFDVTLNQVGAGEYTFTVHEEAPAQFLIFDFNDLPSGQNLFGTVGDVEKAIVVFGSNPDLNADGTMTKDSQTVNSSKGSQFADTVIGNSNNHFDNPGEDLWVLFVNDPNPEFLAGFDDGVTEGLDPNEADDADNVQYGSLSEGTNAFYQASRVTTSGPDKISAQTIHAFNVLDNFEEGQDIVNLLDVDTDGNGTRDNFPPDDTLVDRVDIKTVKIYAPIDLRPEGTTLAEDGVVLLQSTGVDVTAGDLSITFNPDGSVSVTGIEEGMVVEWFTDDPFDTVDIDYGTVDGGNTDGGAYDIGFIGRAEGQDTEPTDVDFQVKITDFDGDMDTSNVVDVTVDGTGEFSLGDFENGVAV